MKEIAITLRCLQMFAQNAHNLVKGAVFSQDHDFLGELYPAYDSEYDSVIERIIGTSDLSMPELTMIQQAAVDKLKSYGSQQPDNKSYLSIILKMEQELCSIIEMAIRGASQGTQQLIGGIADISEMRQYKLKQRIR
jgi:DNA-binding ferritin-like protein